MRGHWDKLCEAFRQAVPAGSRPWTAVLWVGLTLALATSLCHAQELGEVERIKERIARESAVLPTDIPIDISAQKVTFAPESNTYTARGEVTLSQGKTKLRADAIQYGGNTGVLTASGNVQVRLGNDTVQAEKITVKLKDSTGVLVNGKLLLKGYNIYLEGKRFAKTGQSSYRIEDGSFTTCDGPSPDWKIKGKDLDVTLEGYGVLHGGTFFIKNIPVFYVPWLIYPAKRMRQTGFLMPTMANSTARGLDASLPFFLNLSPSVDATLIPRICTNRALQTALEVRYCPLEDLNGRFYGEYTYDWQYAPPGKNNRFFVSLNHNQTLPGGFRVRANGSWVSDRDYFEFWGERLDRRRRLRYLESNLVLNRQWDNFLFQAEVRHVDNLAIPDNAVTVQHLPIVTGNAFNQKIPYTPLYFSSNVGFNHFFAPRRDRQWFGSRWTMDAGLSLPVSVGDYVKFDPSMTYSIKAYASDYYRKDRSIKSVQAIRTDLYQVGADLYTDIESIYRRGFLGFERVRHSIRPRLTWTYRPFNSQDQFPRFDETDRLDRMSLLTAELSQALTGRIGQGQYLDVLTLSVSLGYDFYKGIEVDEYGGWSLLPEEGLMPLRGQLTFKPHSMVDLAAQAEYDPIRNVAGRYSVDMGLMDHRGDRMRVVHQFTRDDTGKDLNRQTNVNVQLKLTDALDWFVENQYSHQFDFSYLWAVGLTYHPQCWTVDLKYSETKEINPLTHKTRDPDQTVFFALSLYGLGQVYRMTKDWSDLLGRPGESFRWAPKGK